MVIQEVQALRKQLAEKGAKLHTIMAVLGHASPHMTMVYAQISDPVVRQDYQAVLGPGATIAGSSAEALQAGTLSPTDLQWRESNFFKTELELGAVSGFLRRDRVNVNCI